MNERIQELMKQASTTRVSGFGETEILDPVKFAELLINECCLLCLHNEDMDRIENHFGVKE